MDWKDALESVKGVYLITDSKTGRRYVGSAYDDNGIWSLWCAYAVTAHGGNVELRALLDLEGLDYWRANLLFALLEHRSFRTPDELILRREEFWKQLLLTRGEHGLNRIPPIRLDGLASTLRQRFTTRLASRNSASDLSSSSSLASEY